MSKVSWILIRDEEGSIFTARSTMREHYQQSDEFEVVGDETYPTREHARSVAAALKKEGK